MVVVSPLLVIINFTGILICELEEGLLFVSTTADVAVVRCHKVILVSFDLDPFDGC